MRSRPGAPRPARMLWMTEAQKSTIKALCVQGVDVVWRGIDSSARPVVTFIDANGEHEPMAVMHSGRGTTPTGDVVWSDENIEAADPPALEWVLTYLPHVGRAVHRGAR